MIFAEFWRKNVFSFPLALASRRFRLARLRFAFSSECGFRECVLFSVQEGGQTEWRWFGRDTLLAANSFICVFEFYVHLRRFILKQKIIIRQ